MEEQRISPALCVPHAWWAAGPGLLISALDGVIQEPHSLSWRHTPVSCSRTVPAGLHTLRGLLWDLLPSWVFSAHPRGTMETWETSPGAGMDQSRANNLHRAFPCPPHRPPLQVSPSSPATTLSRGSRGRVWGRSRAPPAWSSACCGLQVPQLGCAGRTFQGHQTVSNRSPTHHSDQPSSEGAGHSSHILTRLPSCCGSTHRAQAGPFICREHASCPQDSSLITHMPPIPGWNPQLPQPPPLC